MRAGGILPRSALLGLKGRPGSMIAGRQTTTMPPRPTSIRASSASAPAPQQFVRVRFGDNEGVRRSGLKTPNREKLSNRLKALIVANILVQNTVN